ncbi:MAG: glycerol-3-phosphate dehydrogenase/oxidase [Gemmatimonadales bacterium]
MNPSARATVWDLSSRRFDLLVIGGGITGAGIAREAAHRGLAVALVERGDFGSGTSSRSSRLIHGGLRYLEQRRFSLVKESLAERSVLLGIAPHLVRPLEFLFPSFTGDRVARWKLEAALTLYDVLALRGNVRRHRALSKRAVLDHEPLLRDRGLRGGALYWDAQCDDARLTLATLRSAARHGALLANYACVTALELEDGRAAGATVEDQLTGAQGTVHAQVVINATGPWTDALRRLENPGAQPILAPSRGAHVMVPRSRLGHHRAITFLSPIDGRVMFVLPWGDRSYIGTTDTDTDDSPDHVVASEADMLYLLRSANAIFPAARLGLEDVSLSWAGLRPLVGTGGEAGSRSREHTIRAGRAGMITVAGGKLTTYRRMAIETVERAWDALGRPKIPTDPRKTRSATEPLPGGDPYEVAALFAAGVRRGLGEPTVAHLVGQYGSETPTLLEYVKEWPALKDPVHPHHGAIGAQVVHAVRLEFARRLDDVLFRRLSIASETPDAGLAAVEPVSRLMARELGWDESRRVVEADRYRDLAAAIPRGRALSS